MNTFKTKSLYAALAGLSALGATTAAEAVNLNPNGLGQVLIYPYYTTRADSASNAYNSLLSVVNSTATAKAVKVRFLEGKDSREVLDFNLFLSPYDVWTTAILPTTTGGAKILTFDKSCTLPAIPAAGKDFVNFGYTGSNDDGGGSTLDRTKEGYVEIIEMADFDPDTDTAERITHINGVPPGCAANNDVDATLDADPGTGGLFGGISLVNVGSGTDYTADAVALDNFNHVLSNYRNAGDIRPTLEDVLPLTSAVFSSTGIVQSSWLSARDTVSAVMMHDAVLNEYVLDTATKSATDWVVTMPTKRYYVRRSNSNAPPPFQRNFNNAAGACDDVSLNIYDREEQTTDTPIDFSPPPPTGTNSICWEANVITFQTNSLLASVNTSTIPVPTGFQNGWLRLGFPSTALDAYHKMVNTSTMLISLDGTVLNGQTVTYHGLPVIGFAVQSFSNGSVSVAGVNTLSNYGGNFVHKYTTNIEVEED